MKLNELTIHELKDKLAAGDASPADILASYTDRIEQVDEEVKAYITLTTDEAKKKAENGKLEGNLAGIPFALKDNISTKGVETTCASKMLKDYKPPFDATVTKKIKDNGGIILGKANMDEFAMGSTTENSAFFPTHNPWNLDHVTGGSSGGAAAAVAADEAAGALGSDTGGSVRQPASFCGVVGMKPTYGLISRYGVVAFASSLDQIGPITKDVEDTAVLLNVLCGNDPLETTSIDRELPDYTQFLKEDVSDLKIGIPRNYFDFEMNEEVKEKVQECIEKLEKAGAEVEEIELMDVEYVLATYYIIAPAEASSNLARFDGVQYGFRSDKADTIKEMYNNTRVEGMGDEVKRRIMLGTYALSSGYYDAYYLKAQKVRTLIKNEFNEAFEDYDVLITPTTPTTAYKMGADKDLLEMYQSDIFTAPVNVAGIPAISIPCGFDSNDLPIGIQIMGSNFGEGQILQTAYTLEKMLDLNKKPQL